MEATISTSSKVKDYIFTELEHNRLKVGDRLPAETHIANHLNVSRSSVREALQSLKSIGLLNSSQGSCYTITGNTTKIFSEALRAIIATTPICLTDISEIREALEVKAAQLAIRNHISKNSIDDLEAYVIQMEKATSSPSNISKATTYDIDFHRKIAELSGNPFLVSFTEALSQFSKHYILVSWNDISPNQITDLINSHKNIVHCFKYKDAENVVHEIIQHYRIADDILNMQKKQSIEKLLAELYSKGLSNEQILNKLSSLDQL